MKQQKTSLSSSEQGNSSFSHIPLFWSLSLKISFYGFLSPAYFSFPYSTKQHRHLQPLFSPLNPSLMEKSIVLFVPPLLSTEWAKRAEQDVVTGRSPLRWLFVTESLHAIWQLIILVHVTLSHRGPEAWRMSCSPIFTRWVQKQSSHLIPANQQYFSVALGARFHHNPQDICLLYILFFFFLKKCYNGASLCSFDMKDSYFNSECLQIESRWRWITKGEEVRR